MSQRERKSFKISGNQSTHKIPATSKSKFTEFTQNFSVIPPQNFYRQETENKPKIDWRKKAGVDRRQTRSMTTATRSLFSVKPTTNDSTRRKKSEKFASKSSQPQSTSKPLNNKRRGQQEMSLTRKSWEERNTSKSSLKSQSKSAATPTARSKSSELTAVPKFKSSTSTKSTIRPKSNSTNVGLRSKSASTVVIWGSCASIATGPKSKSSTVTAGPKSRSSASTSVGLKSKLASTTRARSTSSEFMAVTKFKASTSTTRPKTNSFVATDVGMRSKSASTVELCGSIASTATGPKSKSSTVTACPKSPSSAATTVGLRSSLASITRARSTSSEFITVQKFKSSTSTTRPKTNSFVATDVGMRSKSASTTRARSTSSEFISVPKFKASTSTTRPKTKSFKSASTVVRCGSTASTATGPKFKSSSSALTLRSGETSKSKPELVSNSQLDNLTSDPDSNKLEKREDILKALQLHPLKSTLSRIEGGTSSTVVSPANIKNLGRKKSQIKERTTTMKRKHPEDIAAAAGVTVFGPDLQNSSNASAKASCHKVAKRIDSPNNDSEEPVADPNRKVPASEDTSEANNEEAPGCACPVDHTPVFIDVGTDFRTGCGQMESDEPGFRLYEESRDALTIEGTAVPLDFRIQNKQLQAVVCRSSGEEIFIPGAMNWLLEGILKGENVLQFRDQVFLIHPFGLDSNSDIRENDTRSKNNIRIQLDIISSAGPTSQMSMNVHSVESVDQSNDAINSNENAEGGILMNLEIEGQLNDEASRDLAVGVNEVEEDRPNNLSIEEVVGPIGNVAEETNSISFNVDSSTSVDQSKDEVNTKEIAEGVKLIDVGVEDQVNDGGSLDVEVLFVREIGNVEVSIEDVVGPTGNGVEKTNSISVIQYAPKSSYPVPVPSLPNPFFRPWIPEVTRALRTENNVGEVEVEGVTAQVEVDKQWGNDLIQSPPPSGIWGSGYSDSDNDVQYLGFFKLKDDDTVSEVDSNATY